MTSAGTSQEETGAPAAPGRVAAVLYVCAERSKLTPTFAADRAEEEGRAFAEARGLTLAEVVTDPYGAPEPCRRKGWMRVRELAEAGTVGVVIVRWPACIAPNAFHELRHREIRWLQDRGVRVRYSWEPLTSGGGEGA
ncbi:recombinase family protein [Streptomyces olivaceus]|uniref:recombinase family protein n=1 Tax=Streptomyces olivaceus TaxID=47716 RepID=UPI001CC9A6C1|nr:recombinase family protein [Streptomyces olivaceus]